jgi:hypothetical protein
VVKLEDGAVTNIARVAMSNERFGGTSGAAQFNADAQVIAVHTAPLGPNGLAVGTGAEHLSALIASVKRQSPFSGWLSQNSRATFVTRHLGDGKTVSQLEGVQPTSFAITTHSRTNLLSKEAAASDTSVPK